MPSIEQLTRLLADEPNDPFLLYAIAQEHLTAGRFDEAVAWFDRTIEADPKHAYAYFHKARAHEGADRRTAAIETLRLGVGVARQAGDQKAWSELAGYLDELE